MAKRRTKIVEEEKEMTSIGIRVSRQETKEVYDRVKRLFSNKIERGFVGLLLLYESMPDDVRALVDTGNEKVVSMAIDLWMGLDSAKSRRQR